MSRLVQEEEAKGISGLGMHISANTYIVGLLEYWL